VLDLAITLDGRCVVTGGDEGEIAVTELATGEHPRFHRVGSEPILALALLIEDRVMVSRRNQSLSIWSLITGEQQRSFEAQDGSIDALAVSPDERTLVACAAVGKELWVSDLHSGETPRGREFHTGYVEAVALTPDGCRAISGSTPACPS
jgi:WD40 repeat protein